MAQSPQNPLGGSTPDSPEEAPTVKLAEASKEAKAPMGVQRPSGIQDEINAPTMKLSQATKEAKAPMGAIPTAEIDSVNAPTIKLAQATKEAKAPMGAIPTAEVDAVNAPTIKLAQATKEAKAPMGAVPPPKKETGKVQPKKETVRINLPPKPTAAPTIKLPTLPPGGPTGATSSAPSFAAPAPTQKASAAPATAAPSKVGSVGKPGADTSSKLRPAATQRPSAPAGSLAIKTLDKVLIYTAAVASLAAVGGMVWVFLTLKNLVENFSS